MPNYGIPQAGSFPNPANNLTALLPGDSFVLFNAESPSAGQASVAFNRAPGYGDERPAGIVFTASWAVTNAGNTMQIQGANVDVDAEYNKNILQTIAGNGFYSDQGNFAFYRAKLTAYVSGAPVTVIAQR